jgi:hypothetical protein
MPLHYHNQIVKEHTANSLLELAKTLTLAKHSEGVNGSWKIIERFFRFFPNCFSGHDLRFPIASGYPGCVEPTSWLLPKLKSELYRLEIP